MTTMHVELYDKQLLWKNFRGEKSRFNARGERTFSVLLEDPEEAEKLKNDGWNIKPLRPAEGETIVSWHLPVKVNYESKIPPKVVWISEGQNKKLMLSDQTVSILDFQTIRRADLRLNAYEWTVDGSSGIKAYLDTLYAVVEESGVDALYTDYDMAMSEE